MTNKISIYLCLLFLTFSCQKQKEDKFLVTNDGGLVTSQYSLIDSLYPISQEADKHYDIAKQHLNNQEHEKALSEIKKTMAIQITPQVYNLAGLIYMGINKDSAIAYFNKSIKSDSQFYYPYNNLSMAYRNKGQFDNSIHISNLGIERAKKSEDLWSFYVNRSITKTFNKQYESAKIDLDSARLLCPDLKLLKEFENFYEFQSSKDEVKDLLETK